jgi:hypothetical protein
MPQPTISQVHVDKAISNVAIAYSNTMFVADEVAPIVPVEKESDKYFKFTAGEWFADDAENDRAPGTDAPRGGFSLTTDNYAAKEKAWAVPVPQRIQDNADDPLRPFENATQFAMQKVMLRKERQAATNLFSSGIWNTDFTVANQWSDFALSDPAKDVSDGIDAVVKEIGIRPNRLLLGHEVFAILKLHPDGIDRFKHTQRGIMTEELMAQWLGVEQIIVGSAVFNSAAEGATASQSFVWGKNALLYYVTPTAAIDVPNAAYGFQVGGAQGVRTRTWREESPDQDVVEATVMIDHKVTAAEAGYFFPSVVA